MSTWLDDDVGGAPLVPAPGPAIVKPSRLRDIEEEIHEEAATVLRDALAFSEIGPEDKEPPFEWVKAFGMEKAWRRFKTAQYALLTPKEAPIGLRIAKDTVLGMARVRAHEKAGPKTLNMVVVQMSGTLPKFDEVEVDK
jgi:hypothetical protein